MRLKKQIQRNDLIVCDNVKNTRTMYRAQSVDKT